MAASLGLSSSAAHTQQSLYTSGCRQAPHETPHESAFSNVLVDSRPPVKPCPMSQSAQLQLTYAIDIFVFLVCKR